MIRTIAPADLPPQVYAHAADFDRGLLEQFRLILNSGVPWMKPKAGTGLWTGTAFDDGTTSWTRWCVEESFGGDSYDARTPIVPAPEARIVLIDDHRDLANLVETFPHTDERYFLGRHVDWQAAAAEFDAVYLTAAGELRTRWVQSGPGLYGWDCSSVLWLRPAYLVAAEVSS